MRPPDAEVYLEEQTFSHLSAAVINKAARGEYCLNMPSCEPPQIPPGNNWITVKTVDGSGDPISGCDVTVWAVSMADNDDTGVLTSGTTDASGEWSWEWGTNPTAGGAPLMNNINSVRLVKTDCAGEPAQAKYLTTFDLQAGINEPGGGLWGDFHSFSELTFVVATTVCGNLILEAGEECDGGPCCNPSTCTLLAAGTQCAPALGECSISANCTGLDASCPNRVYKTQGTPCGSASGSGSACGTATCNGWISICPDCGPQEPLYIGTGVNESDLTGFSTTGVCVCVVCGCIFFVLRVLWLCAFVCIVYTRSRIHTTIPTVGPISSSSSSSTSPGTTESTPPPATTSAKVSLSTSSIAGPADQNAAEEQKAGTWFKDSAIINVSVGIHAAQSED